GPHRLITKHGPLENPIAHAGELPQKRYREPLLANVESARQSRELARIRTDVPVHFDPGSLRYRGVSRERCFEIFNALAFRTLVAEFAPTAATTSKAYRIVSTGEELAALAARLGASKTFALRVLSTGGSAMNA